jgi:pimeloyl-ACP methyl ester carboxylesterase
MNIADKISKPLPGIRTGPADAAPELLFFHATGFNAQTYAPLLARLPAGTRAQAWDLRGHGANPLPADPAAMISWDIYARDILAVLDAHPDWPPLTLSGHSMGAVVALLVAHRRPERVRRVVMIDPPLMPPRWRHYVKLPGAQWLVGKLLPIAAQVAKRRASFPDRATARTAYQGRGAFKSWQPAFLDAYLDGGLKPKADGSVALACAPAWEQATFTGFRHNPWAAFRALRCPLTVLIAERNSTAAHETRRIRRLCPESEIKIIPGSSHFIPMEQPEVVAEVLISAS